MSERRCDWHGEIDHDAIGKRIADAVREPQEGASRNAVPVNDAGQIHDPGGVPSWDSELARIATNLSHSADHHSNHWIEDCRTLLRMVDELTKEQRETYDRNLAESIRWLNERDDLRAKLADADNTIVNLTDEVASYQAEIARLNAAFESAVSAHNADYARLVEEHKQTVEEFAAYIKECEG